MAKLRLKEADFDRVIRDRGGEGPFPLRTFMPQTEIDEVLSKNNVAIVCRPRLDSGGMTGLFNSGYYFFLETMLAGITDVPDSLRRLDIECDTEEEYGRQVIQRLNDLMTVKPVNKPRKSIQRKLSNSEIGSLYRLILKGWSSRWPLEERIKAIVDIMAPLYYAQDGSSFMFGAFSPKNARKEYCENYLLSGLIYYFCPANVEESVLKDFESWMFCTGSFYSFMKHPLDSGKLGDLAEWADIRYFSRCRGDFGSEEAYRAAVLDWAAKESGLNIEEIELV